MRKTRSFLVIPLYLTLCLLAFGQAAHALAPSLDLVYGESSVEWPAPVDLGVLLTVSGPDGLYLRQEHRAGSWPQFRLSDEQGRPRPDGVYKWELTVQAELEAEGQIRSGWFQIQRGRVVAEGTGEKQAVVLEGSAPDNSVYVDNQGRLGLGTSVPGAKLHIKGTDASLAIEDTQAGGREYRLRSQEIGSIGLFDESAGKARWLVDSEGRVGINTTKPTSTFTVDGYIEATKGFLVNGRPVGGIGLVGGSQPLSSEGSDNNFFGWNAGHSITDGIGNSLFGRTAGYNITTGSRNSFFGENAGANDVSGLSNCFFGFWAGLQNVSGEKNSFFGNEAGSANLASYNSFFGNKAGYNNTTGTRNAFFANGAGYSNQIGDFNSFFGEAAGYSNVDGGYNTFFGNGAGYTNNASNNAFFGNLAGYLNSTGAWNSFFGPEAGRRNQTGADNAFFGGQAGDSNTQGNYNSYFGRSAGQANLTGSSNSFFGFHSGYENLASENSFFGAYTGYSNTTGAFSSFFGSTAGLSNTSGHSNSFFGREAGYWNTTGSGNSSFGRYAGNHNTVENFNTFLGYGADIDPGTNPTTDPVTNATAVGAYAFVTRSNSLVLGGVPGFNNAPAETFVGIGTTSPDRQLVVEGSEAVGKFRRYVETTQAHAPTFLFERARGTNTAPVDIVPGDYLGKVQFRGRVAGNMPEYGALAFIASDAVQNGRFAFVDRDMSTERMVILNTGNVGIGTTAPTERLDVAGNLRVRGGIVYGAPEVAVPDYVFEPDYRLMPLEKLRQYVKTEKHLPNVPNAGEIQDNGVNLGEFQMKLLEKVEELTLYTMQQAELIERQKEKAASQDERIRALEETVKALIARDKGGK